MRLGWRNPRPNDFTAPNERPLRDLFGNLQKFMEWPSAGVTISGSLGNGVFTTATLTAIDAPLQYNQYNLVRNNVVQVPTAFDAYLCIAVAGGLLDNVGAGLYTIGIRLNSVTGPFMEQKYTALGTDVRTTCPLQMPCRAGENFDICGSAPAAGSTWLSGTAYFYFLPLA